MKAGFARVSITPQEHNRPMTNLYGKEILILPDDLGDEVYARALVLDDGSERALIVSTDLCMSNEHDEFVHDTRVGVKRFPAHWPGGTRERLATAAGVDSERCVLAATHNHLGPSGCRPLSTVEAVRDTVREAAGGLEHVTVDYVETNYDLVRNRRPWSNTLNDDLPRDQTVRILRFARPDGEPVGFIVNYACHGTILRAGGFPHKLSSEFIGIAMQEVERSYGGPVVSLFLQGASGDTGPPIDRTYEYVREKGAEFGRVILDALASPGEPVRLGSVGAAATTVYPETNQHYRDHLRLERKPIDLSVIRSGDFAVVSTSAELFSSIGSRIMAESPVSHTFVSTCTNGYSGYVPTASAFADGVAGYEICTTPFTEAAEDQVARSVTELFLAQGGSL